MSGQGSAWIAWPDMVDPFPAAGPGRERGKRKVRLTHQYAKLRLEQKHRNTQQKTNENNGSNTGTNGWRLRFPKGKNYKNSVCTDKTRTRRHGNNLVSKSKEFFLESQHPTKNIHKRLTRVETSNWRSQRKHNLKTHGGEETHIHTQMITKLHWSLINITSENVHNNKL